MRCSRYVFPFLVLSLLAGLLATFSANADGQLAAVQFQVNRLADTDDGSCDDPAGTGSGNQDCTLREAINAANLNAASADTITFGVSGAILLVATLPAIDDDLTIDGSGQTIIVSGNDAVRVMEVNSGKTVTVKYLTIAGGKCDSCDGGGIYNGGGTLNVSHSVFAGNTALGSGGGGIFSQGGIVNVYDSILSGNTAAADGGGIYPYDATLNVTRTTFSGNIAGRSGGGIHVFGTLNVFDSAFSDNVSDSGGGIYNAYGATNVANSTFSHNSGIGNGVAGIPGGGGILNYDGVFNVSNSTFSGNYGLSDTGTIRNEIGTLTIKNSIITAGDSIGDCYNSGTLNGVNNLVDDDSCHGGGSGGLGRIDAVTGFDTALGDNGGTTQTHAITGASNAVDAVTDCTYVSLDGNPLFTNGAPILTDQRGFTRLSSTQCDIGSFELEGTPTMVIETDNKAVRYDSWRAVADPKASQGSSRVSNAAGAVVTFRFNGTLVTWLTQKGPGQGKAQVRIDGVDKGTFDLYAATKQNKVRIRFMNLSNAPHKIQVIVLGTKNANSKDPKVSVDAFKTGKVVYENDSAPEIEYGNWRYAHNEAASGGGYRHNSKAQSRLIFQFSGGWLYWLTAKGPAYGKARVSIDGVDYGTFDLYAPTLQFQAPILFDGLTSGKHTVVIKPLGTKNPGSAGTVVAVDAFQVAAQGGNQ